VTTSGINLGALTHYVLLELDITRSQDGVVLVGHDSDGRVVAQVIFDGKQADLLTLSLK
jgi:glycerophosphoryl diester phosphodiesterase